MGATGIAAAELQLTACCKTLPSSSQQCSKSRNYSRHSSIGPSSRAASALRRRWGRIDPLVSSTCGRWVPIIRCREAGIGRTTRLTGLDERRGGGEFRGKRGRRSMAVQTSWGKLDTPRPTFVALEQITGDEHLDQILSEALERNEPIVIDWLAAWCRKCIYLKPKLEKLAAEYHPGIKFYYVDVNTVPQTLVKRADVTLWKNGERVAEVIGGHQVWLVLEEVREMIDLKK